MDSINIQSLRRSVARNVRPYPLTECQRASRVIPSLNSPKQPSRKSSTICEILQCFVNTKCSVASPETLTLRSCGEAGWAYEKDAGLNQLLLLARESVDFLPCGSPLSLAVVSSCHWLALFRFQPTRNIRRVSSKSNIFCGITNQTSRN
jgi:hypothetical protein